MERAAAGLRSCTIAATAGLAPFPAAAEVCDKLRPGWSPDDGPPGIIADIGAVLLTPLGLSVLAALVLANLAGYALRSPALRILAACLPMAAAPLFARVRDPVTEALALSEGCIAHPGAASALFVFATLILVPIAFNTAFNR